MRFACNSSWSYIEIFIAALFFHYFVKHISCSTTRHVFVNKHDAVCLFQRFKNAMVNIEGKQGLYIDDLTTDAFLFQWWNSLLYDTQSWTVRNNSDITSFFYHFRNTQGDSHFQQIGRQFFFKPVAIQALNHNRRIITFQQRVIHACGLHHVPGHTHIHSPKRIDHHTHWRTTMPNAFQTVTTGSYNERTALLAKGSIMETGYIITQRLQAV